MIYHTPLTISKDLSSVWIFGQDVSMGTFMNSVIRTHLTRNIGRTFADVREEMQLGFEENIPVTKGKQLLSYRPLHTFYDFRN